MFVFRDASLAQGAVWDLSWSGFEILCGPLVTSKKFPVSRFGVLLRRIQTSKKFGLPSKKFGPPSKKFRFWGDWSSKPMGSPRFPTPASIL